MFLIAGVIDRLVVACPNIEQLHIGFDQSLSRTSTIAIFSTITKFPNLKWLTIKSWKGEFVWWVISAFRNIIVIRFSPKFSLSFILIIQQIVEKCPELEKLHLEGDIETADFFLHLGGYISSARNLRDLRFFYFYKSIITVELT